VDTRTVSARLVPCLVVAASLLAVAAFAVAPSASASWHYKFHDIFDFKGQAISSAVAKAKKCGPGDKLGTYDYRSFALASGGSTEFEVEVTAKLSVREKFRRLKDVEVSTKASPNIPAQVADEVRNGLLDFHESVYTRWKPGKLKIRHGALEFFDQEVLAPGHSTTPFHPKHGC
jgi:hypothetical protein